jgi:ATP-dependent DNA helicase DinG
MLDELGKHLESQAGRAEGLANCLRRCGELVLLLRHWQKAPAADEADPPVRWVEVGSYSVTFNLTPLSVAPIFKRQLEGHPRAWIFTSATLAVGSDFTHYQGWLGLDEAAKPLGVARQTV